MNNLEVGMWLMVSNINNEIDIINHIYVYEYSKDEITSLLKTRYKYSSYMMLIDKNYVNDFKLISSTERFKNIDYKTLDCGVNYMKLNGDIIYKGDK